MNNKKLNVFIGLFLVLCIYTVSFKSLAEAQELNNSEQIITKTIEYEVIEKELIDDAITYTECFYVDLYDINNINSLILDINDKINNLQSAINSDCYTEKAVGIMKDEIDKLVDLRSCYEADIAKYSKWESEYYYASKVFEFLKREGYSDATACGIIGNMMIETSGGSLDLKPTVYSKTGKYYGLCQWNSNYGLHGATFERQLEYLVSSMEETFRVHGHRYNYEFTYENFIIMDNPASAAQAFAKVYERCGSGSYNLRQQSAKIAYDYFVN